MKQVRDFLLKHAIWTVTFGVLLLVASGVYGFGLFSSLGDGNDNFFAQDTAAVKVKDKMSSIFGAGKEDVTIILMEAKDRTADVTNDEYAVASYNILKYLGPKTSINYYETRAEQFLSKDRHDTYAIVTLDGTKDEQYKKLTEFSRDIKNDKFTVSVGGMLVGQKQTQEQAKTDLERAELISLPILAILLFWFFRSPVAAAIPLVMSGLTIAGALALARLIHHFFPVDTYSLNVITILSVGLSIDYALLAVNRFRDELLGKKSPIEAARKTMQTAGRTIFFSGLTVIICLLSLLLFPVGFMQSVSIGGAASVAVAVFISAFILPSALAIIGKTINRWSLKRHTGTSKGWKRLAVAVTGRPWTSLAIGVIVIGLLVWPVKDFTIKTFDWHVLPSNQSAHYVGKILAERFTVKTPALTVFASFPSPPNPEQLCKLADTIQKTEGVDSVEGAYALQGELKNMFSSCDGLDQALGFVARETPGSTAALAGLASTYVKDSYAYVQIVPTYDASDSRTRTLITHLEANQYDSGVKVLVTGAGARAQDTLDVYQQKTPYVIAIIVAAMIIILSFSLGSVILPLQAVIINSLALFISLGVLIMIFQFNWLTDLLHMNLTGGFELSIPILIFVIAFGLSMDYSVFLYSRMHEAHDVHGDAKKAIIDGVVKTGPIITSAALLLFAVVAAFATSRIAIIQQIGVGLAVAVLVDAFFVRIIFVPAIMHLFGKASWWSPKWLKKLTIKHE